MYNNNPILIYGIQIINTIYYYDQNTNTFVVSNVSTLNGTSNAVPLYGNRLNASYLPIKKYE